MKKPLIAAVVWLTLGLTSAHAEPVTVDKPIPCDKTEKVIKGLLEGQYKEKPIWLGVDDSSRYSLFANEKTGSWTLIQFNDRIACVLGAGEGSRLIHIGPAV